MFYVYIIKSEASETYYVGSTNNFDRRLKEHNLGKSKYTSKLKPWKLEKIFKFEKRTDAVEFEFKIKKSKNIKRYCDYSSIG